MAVPPFRAKAPLSKTTGAISTSSLAVARYFGFMVSEPAGHPWTGPPTADGFPWAGSWRPVLPPRQSELPSKVEAQANGLDLLAAQQQVPHHCGAQRANSFQDVARLLDGLTNADLTQELEDGTLRIGNEWAVVLSLKA